jgi:hypothetical protein
MNRRGFVTPEQRARLVSAYTCNSLESNIARAIRAAVIEEREACSKLVEDAAADVDDYACSALLWKIYEAIGARRPESEYVRRIEEASIWNPADKPLIIGGTVDGGDSGESVASRDNLGRGD